jgi:outer membrane protein OmpA-like peptidoglycan-associated protein
MSDVQLKKKVQLKQKQETPVVALKRKGEAAPVVPPVTQPEDAVSAAAEAAAAAAAAAAAKAASSSDETPADVKAAGQGAPVGGTQTAEAGPATSGAATTGTSTSGTAKSTTPPTEGNGSGNGPKKTGKAWLWLLGVAALALLIFGAYKLSNNSGNKDSQDLVAEVTKASENSNGSKAGANEATANSTDAERDADANENSKSGDASANDADAGTATGSTGTQGNSNTPSGTGSSDNVDRTTSGNNAGNGTSGGKTDSATTGSGKNSESSSTGNGANASATSSNSASGKAGAASDGRQVTTTSGGAANGSAVKSSTSGSSNVVSSSSQKSEVVGNTKRANSASISRVSDTQAICLFAFDSAVVEDNEVLNSLVAKAKESGCKVLINAYADEVGTSEYNQVLSQKRANSVKNYFVSRGVNSVIITATGNGETTQYASRSENRRAEIKLQ